MVVHKSKSMKWVFVMFGLAFPLMAKAGPESSRVLLAIRNQNQVIAKLEAEMEGKAFDQESWDRYMKARDVLAHFISLFETDPANGSDPQGGTDPQWLGTSPQINGQSADADFDGQRSLIQMRPLSASAKKMLKGAACVPFSEDKRESVLKNSDPDLFSRTRYSLSGQNAMWDFSKNKGHDGYITDCSHFVHDVYIVSGMKYPYLRVSDLLDSGLFRSIPYSQADVGDLLAAKYPSDHVGILSRKGSSPLEASIYSATRGGPAHLSSRPTTDKYFTPSITDLTLTQLRMRLPVVLRLECGN
jgi:hypothetical protein